MNVYIPRFKVISHRLP